MCNRAEIWMEMSLLEMGVQLPTTSFPTMNATTYWCFESSLQYQILCSSSVVISPKPVHLISVRPRMFHEQHLNSWASSCTLLQACRKQMFHVPIVVPSFGSLMVVFASVAHLLPPTWGLTVRCMVIVDPGLNHVVSLLCFYHVLSVGLG